MLHAYTFSSAGYYRFRFPGRFELCAANCIVLLCTTFVIALKPLSCSRPRKKGQWQLETREKSIPVEPQGLRSLARVLENSFLNKLYIN